MKEYWPEIELMTSGANLNPARNEAVKPIFLYKICHYFLVNSDELIKSDQEILSRSPVGDPLSAQIEEECLVPDYLYLIAVLSKSGIELASSNYKGAIKTLEKILSSNMAVRLIYSAENRQTNRMTTLFKKTRLYQPDLQFEERVEDCNTINRRRIK